MPNCNFYSVDSDYDEVLKFIFEKMECRVFESYSQWDKELKEFHSPLEVVEYFSLNKFHRALKKSANLKLWPRAASDNVKIARIKLDPEKCNGATFRYCVKGWGLIYLYFHGCSEKGLHYSSTNHNSEKRALTWQRTYEEELGSPNDWDWKIVSSESRKLNYFIKKKSAKKIGSIYVMKCAATVTLAGVVT